jgi:hypothetical protein
MLLIFMPYHGEVGIAPWEYLLSLVYAMLLYVSYARRKNLRLRSWPEYRYYIPGFGMKMLGGLAFTLIYFYYYPGGDTTAYFFSGVAMKQLLFQDPVEYLRQVVLGDNSERAIAAYAASSMPPYRYVFLDGHTFQAVRISSVLSLITFNSYLVSTLLLASLSFMGAWACYRTFVSYFPSLRGRLAIAFLFMPSVVFWGSGISKDTLTFSATCGWVHAVDEVFFKRRHPLRNWALMGFCGAVLVAVKPYIFMVLLPATMLWVFYMRVVRLRNALVRFVLIPLLALGLVAASVAALTRMENLLGKFALDEAPAEHADHTRGPGP